jgi:hypothetical protein
MLAPIAKALQVKGQPFTFLALTTAQAMLDGLGIPSIGFRDIPEALEAEAQHWGRELIEGMHGGPVGAEEAVAYLGANFRDLVEELGEAAARKRYAEAGRHAFLPLATLRRVIKRLAPGLVLATNSPRAERAAILAAGELGIPSICAVDLFALQEVQWIGQPGYASKVCVLNKAVRQMLIEHGRKPEEIEVTGNPAFDRLSEHEAKYAGARLRNRRGWNDGRKVILWASQIEPVRHPFADRVGEPDLPRHIEQELRKIISADPNFRLVVRYHPSERVEFVPEPRVEHSPSSEPIAALLNAVDLVVVTASTVGLEAAIAGRPVISIDMSIFTPDTNYASLGVSHGIGAINEISDAIRAVLAQSTKKFGYEKSEKSATQEVLEVMNNLLN